MPAPIMAPIPQSDEIDGAERAFQAVLATDFGFRQDVLDGLGCEQRVTHEQPPPQDAAGNAQAVREPATDLSTTV